MNEQDLPDFHPQTILRDLGNGDCIRLIDMASGTIVTGASGGGKTSAVSKFLAYGHLAAAGGGPGGGAGGVVLCSKKEERSQWEEWARATGRSDDLVIIDKAGTWRFNPLDWEAARPGEGGGLAINIVALLDELAGAIARSEGRGGEGQGDNRFFQDALHHLNANLVDLPLLASHGKADEAFAVSFPLMRAILVTAPQTLDEAASQEWQEKSVCAQLLREADDATKDADEDIRATFEECRNYWMIEFPGLSLRTRSIVVLSFSMLVRPFITHPLRKLFATDSNISPEDTFSGKIIIVDLPVQEFRLAGRIAQLAWKYCFQIAVMRRTPPTDGTYLRPVFLWADECQNFVSDFDAEYQAVARSAGGCTVYLTQNRESLRRVLGSDDAVDSLLGNLSLKIWCNNSSPDTNEWAAKILGEHFVQVVGTSANTPGDSGASAGVNRNEQRRYFVEPSTFTTLKRGGAQNNFEVEAIVYNGGHRFKHQTRQGRETLLPYRMLRFSQKD
jgi:type IV secretory pathway TraG/TraD family ATPase VirD4